MQPSHIDIPPPRAQEGLRESSQRSIHGINNGISRSTANARRLYSEDSWVEISSRPSSSSLSSAATDEIITTGLRVQTTQGARKQRRPKTGTTSSLNIQNRRSSIGSSQEEYEESESEEDQVLTSSNENISSGGSQTHISPPTTFEETDDKAEGGDDDDDENATALGISNHDTVFTPQPHAFSHPPTSQAIRSQPVSDSYFPTTLTRSQPQRRAQSQRRSSQHSPYNMTSPSHQADHDAALRASLSTLLSCAAAARGLPKQSRSQGDTTNQTRRDAGPLCIISESALLGSDPEAPSHGSPSPTAPNMFQEKGKRKAVVGPTKSGKDARVTKKPKRVEDTISPTLLTWVVSAGVVVLVSAIGFSAGYAMGKEAGMAEANLIGGEGACGKEAMKGGLRRLRWSSSAAGGVRV